MTLPPRMTTLSLAKFVPRIRTRSPPRSPILAGVTETICGPPYRSCRTPEAASVTTISPVADDARPRGPRNVSGCVAVTTSSRPASRTRTRPVAGSVTYTFCSGSTETPVGASNVNGGPPADARPLLKSRGIPSCASPARSVSTTPSSRTRRRVPFPVSATITETGGGGSPRRSRSNCSARLSFSVAIPAGERNRA
jgi:hypothetical protein